MGSVSGDDTSDSTHFPSAKLSHEATSAQQPKRWSFVSMLPHLCLVSCELTVLCSRELVMNTLRSWKTRVFFSREPIVFQVSHADSQKLQIWSVSISGFKCALHLSDQSIYLISKTSVIMTPDLSKNTVTSIFYQVGK